MARHRVPLRRSTQKFVLSETRWATKAFFGSQQYAGFILREVLMRILIAAAMFSALAFTPASAATMACTGENMAKTTTMMTSMPEGPGKMAMGKEMGMANTEMSKGNMRDACMHYMKAQKMSATK
jgi:hypothetical protein